MEYNRLYVFIPYRRIKIGRNAKTGIYDTHLYLRAGNQRNIMVEYIIKEYVQVL